MPESKEAVFEELLESWRSKEDSIIGEWSSDFDADGVKADNAKRDWLRRYQEAS